MTYKIEIENILEGPRPWEWRIFIENSEYPHVTGSSRSAASAILNATIALGLHDDEE